MTLTALEQKPLADILRERGISVNALAVMAGIDPKVTRRAVTRGTLSTHKTCALAIAWALGLEVSDIEWINGLSDTGRPCHTGVPIGQVYNTPEPRPDLCPVHFTALPATKVCDDCNY